MRQPELFVFVERCGHTEKPVRFDKFCSIHKLDSQAIQTILEVVEHRASYLRMKSRFKDSDIDPMILGLGQRILQMALAIGFQSVTFDGPNAVFFLKEKTIKFKNAA